MKIGNSKSQFRVIFSKEEVAVFGTTSFRIQIQLDKVDEFITLYPRDHPHASKLAVTSIQPNGQIILNKANATKTWKFLNQLQAFAPEEVTMQNHGTYWTISRPPMQRESVSRKLPVREHVSNVQVLPKVPASLPKEHLSEAATLASLRSAVALINQAKEFYGESLQIETKQGRVVLLLEID